MASVESEKAAPAAPAGWLARSGWSGKLFLAGGLLGLVAAFLPLVSVCNNLTTRMPPGARSIWVGGIDDRGDISGYHEDANGDCHAFYGQAVPEPGSLAMMAAGVVEMAVLRPRRRR